MSKPILETDSRIDQRRAECKPVDAIARMMGLTRKTVYKAIKRDEITLAAV